MLSLVPGPGPRLDSGAGKTIVGNFAQYHNIDVYYTRPAYELKGTLLRCQTEVNWKIVCSPLCQ